jgi:NAD(P)-dependent dehydrogenase (short-subunit alcohol dehydrogenase family)
VKSPVSRRTLAQLADTRRIWAGVLYYPTGIAGRNAPLYGLNALDWFRDTSLEAAVEGKVAMVTGASSGIGRASALRIGRAGATVLLVARRAEALEEVREEIESGGGTAHVHACDLSEPSAIEQLAAVVLERRGNVDILVNSAGHSIRRSVEMSYRRFHDYERTMQLNYFGSVRLILALLPSMQEQGSGHVVNISTAGVQARSPRFSAYTASKTALDGFTDCVAGELLDEGVRFTKVEMPLVRTPMIEPSRRYYRSVPSISAEEAADRVAAAIVYRPRRIGTAFSDMAGVLNLIVPGPMERLRNVGYRLTGDSRAARAASGPSDLRDFEETNIETKEHE